ncbi:MAG: hypothetical protein ACLPN5_21210 [Roseiarcus sp.]
MSDQVKHRRDTPANIAANTPAQGELWFDTTNMMIHMGDGATAGGWPHALATRTPVSDANYTALATDRLIAYTAITAARTVTLCASSAYPLGAVLTVVDESGACSSSDTITVAAAGTDTVDGAANAQIAAAYGTLALESNGAGKWTLVQGVPNLQAASLGVGTPPSSGNALTVSGTAALFTGTNFSLTLNKAASTDTASIIFEDGFSGRAQMGLNGSDSYSLKVSPDGSTWYTGFTVTNAVGVLTFGSGAVLAAGVATLPPLRFVSGTLETTAAAGAAEFDGAAFYLTAQAASRQVAVAEQIQVLASAYTLTSQTAAQQLLNATTNGAVTLAVGTYEFECFFSLSSMSATSGSFGFALGGSATFTQSWMSLGHKATGGTAASPEITFNTAANTAIVTADTNTSGEALIKGILRVTGAGTVIPQVSLGVAAAAVAGANSYFKCWPIGSATVTTVGDWS